MRIASLVLLLLGGASLGFGWWGIYTLAGQRAYKNLDVIIPAVVGALGGVLVGVSVLLFVIHWWRGRGA